MIPVIDIFAGPGGLGEGFAAVTNTKGEPAFDLVLSVEKDAHAFETLKLRSFFRQFRDGCAPQTYYDCVRGNIGIQDLYTHHSVEAHAADASTWHAELGSENLPMQRVRARIQDVLNGCDDWVLLGGPPCQAFSIAGRSRNRGKPGYSLAKDLRHRLYVEYLQVLGDHVPTAFVMENVKGLLSATVRNQKLFQQMVADLCDPAQALRREGRPVWKRRRPKYRIFSLVEPVMFSNGDLEGALIAAERYGVPQARHRVILLGIRDDLSNVMPPTLQRSDPVSVSQVLKGLPRVRSGLSRISDDPRAWTNCLRSQTQRRWANAGTVKAGGDELREYLHQVLSRIEPPAHDRGSEFVAEGSPPQFQPAWYADERLGGICNHTTRSHMVPDLHRYVYASCYARIHGRSPTLQHLPTDLLPDHVNVKIALEEGGNFSDRFRVHLDEQPAATITSHIHKDGHYYIHPDPTQCRTFTVREAARLQTFPDNYFFTGPRTSQYIQVGNAVPPLLAKQIGDVVLDALTQAGLAT